MPEINKGADARRPPPIIPPSSKLADIEQQSIASTRLPQSPSTLVNDVNDDDYADNIKNKKSRATDRGKLWSCMTTPHCLFALVATLITLATVAAVTTLVLYSTDKFVEKTVTDKAVAVIRGAVTGIHREQRQVELRAETTRLKLVAKNTSSSPDPYTILVELNSTMMLTVGSHLKSSNDTGIIFAIMGPPRSLESYPEKQDIDVLGQCPILCRPSTQPAFTQLAQFAIFRDEVINRPVEYRIFFSDANNSNNVVIYNLSLVVEPSRLRPPWAYDGTSGRDRVEHNWVRGAPIRTIQPLLTHGNGSMFEGSWSRVSITSSPNGHSYYLTAFRQAFRHPHTNLTIVMNSIVNIKRFQQILKDHVSESLGDNNRLLLVDEIPRVIAYNRDNYGDGRLENCTIVTPPGSTDRECEKLFALEHPSPFIRSLFENHLDFIMHKSVENVQQRWIYQGNTRYLMVVCEVFRTGTARIIAVYIISENAVVGDLKRASKLLAVASGFVVAAGFAVLALAGFLSLRGAQQTVQLLSTLAVCLTRYDLEAAMATISAAQSRRRFFKAPTAMELQFTDIVQNLQIYRRFLPVSILLQSGSSTPKNEKSLSQLTVVPTSPKLPHENQQKGTEPTSAPSTQALVSAASHPRRTNNDDNRHQYLPSRKDFHIFNGSLLLLDMEVLSGGDDGGGGGINNTARTMDGGRRQTQKYHSGHVNLPSDMIGKCIAKVERFGGIVEMIRMNQLLVSFNCHTKIPQHEAAACHCALEIRSMFYAEGGPMHRSMAIAITSGSGIMGSAGSASVKAVVLAGEPVDLILRMPSLQRMLGVGIIASHSAVVSCPAGIDCVPVDAIAPLWWQQGRSAVVEVYTILDSSIVRTPAYREALRTQMSVFQKLYTQRDPVRAANTILRLPPATVGGSYPLQRLLALCEARISHQKQQQQQHSNSLLTTIASSASCVRVETPWMELEGRDFFSSNKTEQMDVMLLKFIHSDSCGKDDPQNIDPTAELYRAHEAQRNTKRSLLGFKPNSNSVVAYTSQTTTRDDGNPLEDEKIVEGEEDRGEGDFTSLFGMFLPTEKDDEEENNIINNHTPENDEDEQHNNHQQGQLSLQKLYNKTDSTHINGASPDGGDGSSGGGGGNSRHLVEAVTGDKYFITGKSLGEGTFGSVVLALHETGGLVAMKQIPIGSLEGGVEPLIAEMALLKDLNHPCIASYVTCAVGSRNNTFYIMTEYLPAGSLSDLINAMSTSPPSKYGNGTNSNKISKKNKGFTLETTCRFAHDIADGLQYLHSRQPPVLHLDIKPDNVLMTGGSGSVEGGSCKLIDFGTSKFFVEAESSMTVRGTPRYMAPEAALGEVSPASDVYSVGITMLHMLLGHSPWSHVKGDDNAFIMRLMRGGEMVLQMPSEDDCDPVMITLIEECTAMNPQHRPSAQEVRNRLAKLLAIR